jgi:DsbC/DsbD-like thiol-disulfide interchange protein
VIRRHTLTLPASWLLAVTMFAAGPSPAAQSRPKPEITPIAEPARVRPGKSARLVLKVALPEQIHIQSNKPRDEALFPTALVVTPPAGVTVASTSYPPAVDFKQEGQDAPLAVFEKTFTVTATIAVDASVKPGELTIPGRFDYQACDDKVCYRPIKMPVSWTITVAP